jgi:hypothetical protein
MPEPLDYFNPMRKDQPDPKGYHRHGPSVAVPVEFDVVLTETPDHAGARAVEAELGRLNIAFFRTERGDAVNRVVELHVRSADQARASQAAAMIFARRRRLNQLSPRRPAPRYDPQTGGSIDGLTSMLPP